MIRNKLLLTALLLVMLPFSSLCFADLDLSDGGASGQWYNQSRDGEGIFVEIIDSEGIQKISVAWFTFDENGNQMWLVGLADLQSGQTAVTIPVVVTSGPKFGPDYDPAALNRTPWGTLSLNFSTCSAGILSYASSVGFGSGAINLSRLTSLTQVRCDDPPPVAGLTPGRWTGSGVCFYVSQDGRSLTSEGSICSSGRSVDTDIEHQMDENGSLCDVEVETKDTIAIVDGSFAYSKGGESIVGTFTSSTSARGVAQEVESTTCTGEWVVSPDNP
jgi:hypothetical protein